MAIFTNAVTLTGSGNDDFLLGDATSSTANTIFGGDGNDYIIGDADAPVTMAVLAGSGTSAATAYDLTGNLDIWSKIYNPDIINSTTVTHATAIIEGNGTVQWFAVTMVAGQILTLDVDYGDANIGGNLDTEIFIYDATGTNQVGTNDDAAITEGAGGSNSTNDSFLTYTALVNGVFYIKVQEFGPSVIDAGDSYMLNISLNGQTPTTPASGNDDLYGGNGNDSIYGIGGNDNLFGGVGDDYMTGDAGNDTLDGGAGNDKMYGGDNNDTFSITNGFNTGAGDEVYGGAMTDTLDLSALTGLSNVLVDLGTGSFTSSLAASITTIVDVENVIGTAFNDVIIGSAASNTLFGGAGDDSLTGGAGTDKFVGGAGNDTFFTNSSSEVVTEAAGEGTNDRVIASATFSLAAGSAVEIIQTDNAAGTTAINLTGNALAQTITGNAAANTLDDGGVGAADTLIGGAGNDTYNVSNAGTIIVENAIFNGAVLVPSNDRISASVSFTLAADDDIEAMTTNSSSGTTAINLTGNALRQTITGNDGDNVLNTGGGAAADTMSGNGGNDTYMVNNAADVISEVVNDGTADRVQSTVSYVLGTSTNIEFLETANAAGTGAINLSGSNISQTLTGNAGANALDGKLGNDTLVGGAGNDTFAFSTTGGATNTDLITDFVVADDQIELNNSVFTTLTAALGSVNSLGQLNATAFAANATGVATSVDTRIIYNTTTGALSYDSNGSTASGTEFQFATLSGAPTITAADIVAVTPGSGAAGNIITGTSGNDTAATTGTASADTIYGLGGDDVINGGLGNDLSFGGTGNDTYTVQGTSDVVTEFAGEGTNDVVNTAGSFVLTAGSEVEVIQTTNAAGVLALNISGNALAQSITGNAGVNTLNDGGGLGDTLTGLAGNDIYVVSSASTIINEVAGGGVDRVAAGVSFVLAADDDIEQLSTANSAGAIAINLTGNLLTQTITGNAGNNVLNSGGGAADTMSGLAGNDTYVVRNSLDMIGEGVNQGTADRVVATVSFVLDAGDDIEFMNTINAAATTAINLTGNLLAQTIIGNAGDNRLDGKAGIDTLTGGAGNDTFILSSAAGAANADTITDYSVADDQILLGNTIFTTLTPGTALAAAAFAANATGLATDADQRIIYNTATGALFYDADGIGAGAALQIATLASGLAMTAAEFAVDGIAPLPGATINGTVGNDILVGTAANERINGLAGDDTIGGSAGNDTMFGGIGNDTFIVQNSSDVVTELAAEGTNDVIQSSGSFTMAAGSAVEGLQTTNAALTTAINLTGNALAQTITGNAGANALNDGGGAADTMTGLAGNDIYNVGNAGTIINEVAGGGTADRVAASVSFVLAADDDIELLTTANSAGSTAINLTGNALAQTITGNAGANTLNSGGGVADTMAGLAGNDIYMVRNAADVIVELINQGTADRVNAAVNFVLDASDDIEILATANDLGVLAQNLTGNATAQSIIGNAGINTLNDGGGAGADTMTGLGGNDLYLVGSAGTSVIEAVGGGADVVRATASFTLTAGSEVETIQTANALGITAINLTGNELAQSITGNGGVNILNDGATGAADTLTGLDESDIYVVNNLGTIIVEGFSGGLADEVRATVNFTLAADDDIELLSTNNAAGTTAINLTGNALEQQITGNAGNNTLDSFVGAADTMTGGAGNDIYLMRNSGDVYVESVGGGTADEVRVGFDHALLAGAEIEILSTNNAAGIAALTLTGNAFGQTINSNAGINTLVGLGGNDTYTVNNAATVVIEAAAGGTDRVNASISFTLDAGLEIEVLATTNDAGTGVLTLTGNELGQTIIGNNAASTLIGLDGNDVYVVNNAATVVTEAAAGGTDTVNASVSYTLTGGTQVETLQTTNAVGTSAINLTGNALAQTIIGNAGINMLNDGSSGGVDTLIGLQGNDSYIINSVGTIVTEAIGGGVDTIQSVVNFTLSAGSEIENLMTNGMGGTANLNLTGNALAQTITGNAGINTLNDGGAGAADTLIGLSGSDVYVVNNAGTVITEAVGLGLDTVQTSVSYTMAVGVDVETMTTTNAAGTGAINLTGNAVNQAITGNAGANVIDGKAGNDVLSGGAGADTFVFSTALNAATNLDTISDFVAIDDTMQLSNAIFGALGGTILAADFQINATGIATTADAHIIYNSTNGQLFYDADGNGVGASIQFATLTGAPTISLSDFTVV